MDAPSTDDLGSVEAEKGSQLDKEKILSAEPSVTHVRHSFMLAGTVVTFAFKIFSQTL